LARFLKFFQIRLFCIRIFTFEKRFRAALFVSFRAFRKKKEIKALLEKEERRALEKEEEEEGESIN
jgi:hypothetical protein